MLSGHTYRTKFLHKPSSFSPWVPSTLMDLPLPGDTFCSSCAGTGHLLPPSLTGFSRHGDPTRSLIHRGQPDGSSLFSCSPTPYHAAAQPQQRDAQRTGMPRRAHRFSSPALTGRNITESVQCSRRILAWFLICKRWRQWVCRRVCECARFDEMFDNLSNEPKVQPLYLPR